MNVSDLVNEYLVRHSHGHDHDHEDEGSPTTAKATAMAVLFISSFTLGCLPIKLSKMLKWDENPKNNGTVRSLLCFGGGVLLCTTFLHLLPEVTEGVDELQENDSLPDLRMNLPCFLMLMGFFIMYLVEELVHFYLHRRQKNNELNAIRRSLSIRRGEDDNDVKTLSTIELVKDVENNHIHDHDHSHGHSHLVLEDGIVKSLRGLLVVLALSVHELFEGLAVGLESSPRNVWYMFGAVAAHKLVIAFCIGVELVITKTKMKFTIIYVFTFAVVSPLGIGIGILVSEDSHSDTDIPSVILQGIATGTLLYVVFFEILQSDRKGGLLQFLSVLIGFIVMLCLTVFGIGTGIALSETGTSEVDVTSVVLQGMAAGTLLYVVFFEVLARERSNKHGGIWQLLAIIAGFSVMFILQVLTGHDHDHGHEHGHEPSPSSTPETLMGHTKLF